jgi:hypothetical protein
MILIPLLVAAASQVALPAAPEAAMVRFLDLNARAALQGTEGKALLAGELDRLEAPTFGSLAAPDKIQKTGVGGAVARIPSDASHPDLYFFLTRGPAGWTITAIRALALTGIAAEMIRMDEAHPSSDPRVRQAVKNARLTLSPDRDLLAWAAANRPLLDRARANPDAPGLEAALKQAGGNRAYRDGGTIHVSIGGIVDNEVGFLWTDGKPPAMDPHSYIWIEAAGDGWYLYKTT